MLLEFDKIVEAFKIGVRGVFHIGAHYGQEFEAYKKLGIPKTVMFEPSKKNFEELSKNLGNEPTAKLVNIGLSSKKNSAKLFVESKNNGMSNSLLEPALHTKQYPHIVFHSHEEVELDTLDNWLVENDDYRDCNVIVIDVQGFEFEVFQGALEALKNVEMIVCEVNRAELYKNSTLVTGLDSYLRYFGFRRVATNWIGETWGDAAYVRTSKIEEIGARPMGITLLDKSFEHATKCLGFDSCCLLPTARFNWDRDGSSGSDILVITDSCLDLAGKIQHPKKIAWLLEPAEVSQHTYDYVTQNANQFVAVACHNIDFLSRIPNGVYTPSGCTWIKPNDWKVFDKSKLCSIVLSNKNFTYGHRLRIEAASLFKNDDIYGSYKEHLEYKLDALRDYKFSVAIENSKVKGFFTEKIIDCLITGTVPIYWGAPNIGDFFDAKGIISFNTLEELKKILEDKDFLENFYAENQDAILANSVKARNFASVDESFLNAITGVW
jgi:FkbM family methyltransferase